MYLLILDPRSSILDPRSSILDPGFPGNPRVTGRVKMAESSVSGIDISIPSHSGHF